MSRSRRPDWMSALTSSKECRRFSMVVSSGKRVLLIGIDSRGFSSLGFLESSISVDFFTSSNFGDCTFCLP